MHMIYQVLRWLTPSSVVAMVAAHYLWPAAFVPIWAFVMTLVPANLALVVGEWIGKRWSKDLPDAGA